MFLKIPNLSHALLKVVILNTNLDLFLYLRVDFLIEKFLSFDILWYLM